MSKLSDTKIPITEFLEAYRRQPCLYNTLLDSYKNRVSREEAYGAIIRSLKIPQLTVSDIKLKIKSGKNNSSSAQLTTIKSDETSKLLCTAAADITMSEDALEEEDAEVNGEPEECPLEESRPTASICKDDSTLCLADQPQQEHYSQGCSSSQQLPHTMAQRKSKYITSLDSAGEDDLIIFGQSIASQLRTIPDSYSRSVAKLRIQQVLFEAETGQFQSTEVNSTQLQNTF
uniref:Uncharacterized protein, isoform D n=1 Tax=Drosophila melanogaster TaxID=7227 RepID=X2JKH0_DROME|nr:uncharacterized protein Dmel_CG15601, isoform D [Drosophila melanogaster]AHN59757.1 uncharacterized protein Dmel_CG15601, isoform D [Drosophila melanogaster]|eukprot:NP_001285287.1 uncharacterized protein Dmel_CG15601, isoform D [Drosophila melanogaster]